MTALLLDARPIAGRPELTTPAVMTLEALVSGAWRQLGFRGRAACPACGGEMSAHVAAGRAGVSGVCADCGSELR